MGKAETPVMMLLSCMDMKKSINPETAFPLPSCLYRVFIYF